MMATGRGFFSREFGDELEGGIRVIDVVVRQLLALQQGCRRNARTILAGDVESGLLMRIFAVTHLFLQDATDACGEAALAISSTSANQPEMAVS